jgi:tetratricopeptide (TPR) repeat protein
MPNGESVPIEDTDKMLVEIQRLFKEKDKIWGVLSSLAQECTDKRNYEAASSYACKMLDFASDQEKKTKGLLLLGSIKEKMRDYESAKDFYSEAVSLGWRDNDDVWYFLNNNLAYCLNSLGRYGEAEYYCLSAVDANPNHHNAYKNLGIALQGQCRYGEAADCFISATKICPLDPRAFNHLKELVQAHPEIIVEKPDLMDKLDELRGDVFTIKGPTFN